MAFEVVLRVIPVVLWVIWVWSVVTSIVIDLELVLALTAVSAESVAVVFERLTPLCILHTVKNPQAVSVFRGPFVYLPHLLSSVFCHRGFFFFLGLRVPGVTRVDHVELVLLTEAAARLQPVSNRNQVFVLVCEPTRALFEMIKRLSLLKMFRFFLAATVAVVGVRTVSVEACAMLPGATVIHPGVWVEYVVVEPVVVDCPIRPFPEPFLVKVVPVDPTLDDGSELFRYLCRAFFDAVDHGNG
jgi:hypothetical protein